MARWERTLDQIRAHSFGVWTNPLPDISLPVFFPTPDISHFVVLPPRTYPGRGFVREGIGPWFHSFCNNNKHWHSTTGCALLWVHSTTGCALLWVHRTTGCALLWVHSATGCALLWVHSATGCALLWVLTRSSYRWWLDRAWTVSAYSPAPRWTPEDSGHNISVHEYIWLLSRNISTLNVVTLLNSLNFYGLFLSRDKFILYVICRYY